MGTCRQRLVLVPYLARVARPIERAELLSVGTELLVGETRDTNSGDLARELTALGVEVLRATALPDRLDVVAEAVAAGLERADLVVSTGGLGPTPDDLTREAIAKATGRTPVVDPGAGSRLRGLFERRKLAFRYCKSETGVAGGRSNAAAQPQRHGARLVAGPA